MERINTSLKEAALEYANKGISVFPLVPNEKRPLSPNGFKDATTDLAVINAWWSKWPEANIGIPTGEVTGWLVLDIDVKNSAKGMESIAGLVAENGELPVTLKHKTPSGGYHLIFRYIDGNARCSAGKVGPGLDIRGNGGYIVAPPSIIESKKYEVANPEVPIANTPEWLLDLASKQKVTVRTGQRVGIGERNNHIFDVAVNCRQQGTTFEDCLSQARTVNLTHCSPPLDDHEVQKTVESAYSYEMNEIQKEILEMNEKYAVVMVGGKCRVLKEITCPVFNWPDIELSPPKDFREFHSNKYIKIDGKSKRLGEAWFNHPKRREYEQIVFAPGQSPEGCYNLWRGFAVEPVEGDCSLYLKHIEENIANGNKEVYQYILGWMAHAVQHPDDLVGTAIVLRGAMGTGKGVFANGFGSLFGRHYLPMNQSSQLTGKFNAHMKDVVVLLADEAFWAGDKAAEGVLKGLITEPFLTIEGKGENAFKLKNHLHMIFATNNDWAVPAGPEERRFFVLDVGDKHRQDHAYFEGINNQLENGGREALLYYLMNYDLSNVNLRNFPKTKALLETKLQSLTPVQKFWYHKLEEGWLGNHIGWNAGQIETSELYVQYLDYVSNLGFKHKAADNELGMQLGKMLPKGKIDKKKKGPKDCRRYYYFFPSLDECRKSFELFINQQISWPVEEE